MFLIHGALWFLSISLLGLAAHMKGQFWQDISLDQLLFHLSYGFEGIVFIDEKVSKGFLVHTLVAPIFILSSAMFFRFVLNSEKKKKLVLLFLWFFLSLLFMLPIWKQTLQFFPELKSPSDFLLQDEVMTLVVIQWVVPILILIVFQSSKKKRASSPTSNWASSFGFVLSVLVLAWSTNAFSFFHQRWFGEDRFAQLYYQPQIMFQTVKPKNLILIYFESLERKYEDSRVFGDNFIKLMTDLQGEQIPHFHSAPGTGWSMAGMAASQCSIPLKLFQVSFLEKTDFLPGVVCLSDVLAKVNYQQYFLVGTNSSFQGMKSFYESHAFNGVLGREHWVSLGYEPNQLTSWGKGLHDDDLLNESKKLILKLASGQKPFNITIMTADSHFPNGTPSTSCPLADRKSNFYGATRCSARWVTEFITWLKGKKLLDDTIIILMGDHLFLESPNQRQYFEGHRDIFFKLISPSNLKLARDNMTHFDVAPTILDLLGLLPEGSDRFGLGVSLLSKEQQSYEKHLNSVLDTSILNSSTVYDRFLFPASK